MISHGRLLISKLFVRLYHTIYGLNSRMGIKKVGSSIGFTIVELLIVVVVIAILAAISIVAYNGIQNRAKTSAAQSTTKQAFTKIQTYAVSNADTYPADLADAGLTNSDVTNYQYRFDNSVNPRTFCLTTTTQNISYYVSSAVSSPTLGACSGHGINGSGVVTNLAKRPTPAGGSSVGWSGYSAAGGYTISTVENAWGNNYSYRWTLGSAGFSATGNIGLEYNGTTIAVSGGSQVTASIHVRSSKAGSYDTVCQFFNSTPTQLTGSCPMANPVDIPANTWVRLEPPAVTAPAGTDRMNIRARYRYGTTWTAGDWIEVSGVSTAPGAYADGNSPGWIWNGAPGLSTSTGPQL